MRLRRRPLGLLAVFGVLLFFGAAALAGVLAPYFPARLFIEFVNRPQPPSLHGGHLLGTDTLGRDVLSQLLYAIRQSAQASLICAGGATFIGVVVGAVTGFYGGPLDTVLSWLTGMAATVPALAVLLLVIVYHWPLSPVGFGLTLMLYLWTSIARAVRASFMSLRQREYVDAARSVGASDLRLITRHLLPNSVGPIIAGGTSIIGQSIAIIATATFFGYGTVQADKPTLGSLIAQAPPGYGYPWWISIPPLVVLALLLLCVNFAGDTLDDALRADGR